MRYSSINNVKLTLALLMTRLDTNDSNYALALDDLLFRRLAGAALDREVLDAVAGVDDRSSDIHTGDNAAVWDDLVDAVSPDSKGILAIGRIAGVRR